jgi:hypothetical protein
MNMVISGVNDSLEDAGDDKFVKGRDAHKFDKA